jgi:hypothetical protein
MWTFDIGDNLAWTLIIIGVAWAVAWVRRNRRG